MHQCKDSQRRTAMPRARMVARDRIKSRGKFMLRRDLLLAALAVATLVAARPGSVRGDEDPRTALEFVQALRERGYFDLASDYLDTLRNEKATPDDVRSILDYEYARLLIDEASKTGDLVRRKE